MPVFEYRCVDCDSSFEALVRRDQSVSCPSCGSESLDKLISAGVMLRGGRTGEAGLACCGREERCEMAPCDESGECFRRQ